MSFCTSLRRRASFVSVVPTLTTSNTLSLRESKLETHDIAIPLNPTRDPRTGINTSTRHLRVLLLTPTATSPANLPRTLERIHRFALLTGGQDLAIIFLLSPPKSTDSIRATAPLPPAQLADDTGPGIHAYSSLHAALLAHGEMSAVPVLPVATAEKLPEVLRRHAAALSSRTGVGVGVGASKADAMRRFALLRRCTTAPPMDETSAYVVTDVFVDLREFAVACAMEAGRGSGRWGAGSGGGVGTSDGVASQLLSSSSEEDGGNGGYAADRLASKVQRLRDLLGEEEARRIVEFWAREWALE